jgi:hypothetical protein
MSDSRQIKINSFHSSTIEIEINQYHRFVGGCRDSKAIVVGDYEFVCVASQVTIRNRKTDHQPAVYATDRQTKPRAPSTHNANRQLKIIIISKYRLNR